MTIRCAWASTPLLAAYHDAEWGVPQHDDRMLFEMLTLEGAQAGLNWSIILQKREGYRAAFANFDPAAVAAFDDARIDILVADPAIIRHRGKIAATIHNARAFLAVQQEYGSFDAYLWSFTSRTPIVTRRPPATPLPPRTELSDRVSKDLRQRGFKFVGTTIVYAYLQAIGIVDDHQQGCIAAKPDSAASKKRSSP